MKQQIIDFMSGFSIETTPGSAAKIPDYREHLRPGALVAVTFLPGSDYLDTVAISKRLRAEGFVPAPHFAARSIKSTVEFEDFLNRLKVEADVDQAVALAGAVDKPLGPYESSMDLLSTGLFDKYGIKTIGVAGHPEGNPDIPDAMLKQALDFKNDFSQRSDANVYIATQFVFEAAPVIAWDKLLRENGNTLPIHIGVPGLASLKSLIAHATACGVGPSIRFLTRQARHITKLMKLQSPDQLIIDLAQYKAQDPDCGISKVHMYPLGGLRRSAKYAYLLADGEFDIVKDSQFQFAQTIE